MNVLRIERDGELATVVLNRPEALNALSNALCDAIVHAFRELADDGGVRAVILTGEGRAFSAGVDLKELSDPNRKPAEFSPGQMIDAVRNFPGPVIAAVNGFAITGGFELALGCDLILASSEARCASLPSARATRAHTCACTRAHTQGVQVRAYSHTTY